MPTIRAFEDRLRQDRSNAMVKKVIGSLGAIVGDSQERGLSLLVFARRSFVGSAGPMSILTNASFMSGKERTAIIGKPKSHSGDRTVPFPPLVANTLKEWKLACPHGEFVFPTGAGTIESHSNIVKRGLAPVQVAAGVINAARKAKYTGLHSFRHFYASWCINRKADGGLELPLKTVQARLGHSTLAMTADTYGHLFPRNDNRDELEAAERSLLG